MDSNLPNVVETIASVFKPQNPLDAKGGGKERTGRTRDDDDGRSKDLFPLSLRVNHSLLFSIQFIQLVAILHKQFSKTFDCTRNSLSCFVPGPFSE